MENLNLQSLKYLAGVKTTIAECGMGQMGSNTPASINITAGSGQELTGMLKDIMNLAGVHKVEPHHMPVDTPDAGPSTVISAPKAAGSMVPDMHKLMSIVDGPEIVKDSMNQDGEEETEEGMIGAGLGGLAGGKMGQMGGAALGSLVGGPVGGAVGAVAGDIAGTALGAKAGDKITGEEYDNSPDQKVMGDPMSQFGDINSGDHRERQKGLPVAKPVEETFKTLFAEYEKFIAEGKSTKEGLGAVAKKVAGAAKKVAGAALNTLGHGSDEELLKDLKKKAGVRNPQNAKPSMAYSDVEKVKEGAVKQAVEDLKDMSEADFKKKYGKTKAEARKELASPKRKDKPVAEARPSAGMTAKEKSAVVKKAQKGGDIGKPGKGFAKVEKAAAKGGAKDPKAVAAAAMWKSQAKK